MLWCDMTSKGTRRDSPHPDDRCARGPREPPRSTKARVEVLLSTFEPGPFLGQLLDSVWAQDYPDLSLLVRDDGSHEAGLALVRSELAGQDRAKLVEGSHVGAGKSFLALLALADPAASYVAFCDQDDIWLPGKISEAVKALQCIRGPGLYCSAVELVDNDLASVKVYRRCKRGPSFENALVENIATGCTVVLNRPAVDLLASRSPQHFVMHDAWAYLVVAGCGTVIYDPRPQVLYRLHGSNAVGVGGTLWAEWSGRVLRQLHGGNLHEWASQARELERLYGSELRPDAARSLDDFLQSRCSAVRRVGYALRGGAHFQRRTDDLLYRLLYVAHRH